MWRPGPAKIGAHDTLTGPFSSEIAMSTALTNAQKRYLRGLAHDLRPVLLVGAKGVTPAVLSELDLALEQHELIKIRVAAGDRDERDAWIGALVEASGASLAGRIGHVAILYRRSADKPFVILPRA
jgi:RNA-binding protein